jgi:DNA-binding beta-propeller fold protein YncE
VDNVTVATSPASRTGVRLWWTLACVAYLVVGAAVLAFDVHRFLYGDVTVLPVGASPTGLVVSPDGRTVYLANLNDSITPVSAATGKAGKAIAISGGSASCSMCGGLAITPDGRTLFATVTTYESDNSLPLARVDLRTGKETGQVRVPGGVSSFVLSPDGRTLYVVSGSDALIAVDAATGRQERRIPVPESLLGFTMVLSPDGRTLYTATTGGDDPSGGGTVTPVNLRTGAVGRPVSVGWQPVSLAITPDGRTLYVAVDGMNGPDGQVAPNRVKVIDTATDRVRASIPWKVPPEQLAMAPDGATVWVMSASGDRNSTADDTLTPVSVASGRPGPSIRTGGWLNDTQDAPMSVMLSPDGRRLYVAVYTGLEMFSAS